MIGSPFAVGAAAALLLQAGTYCLGFCRCMVTAKRRRKIQIFLTLWEAKPEKLGLRDMLYMHVRDITGLQYLPASCCATLGCAMPFAGASRAANPPAGCVEVGAGMGWGTGVGRAADTWAAPGAWLGRTTGAWAAGIWVVGRRAGPCPFSAAASRRS